MRHWNRKAGPSGFQANPFTLDILFHPIIVYNDWKSGILPETYASLATLNTGERCKEPCRTIYKAK